VIGIKIVRGFRFSILLVLGVIFTVGCTDLLTKELDIEDDFDFETQLGLSGILRNDYSETSSLPITQILLAENQSILEPNLTPIYHQTDGLNLYKDGEYFNTFFQSEQGIHRNQLMDSMPPSFLIEQGSYRVELDHPDFGLVSAETQMPKPVFVNYIEVKESSFTTVEVPAFQKRYEVKFRFYDPPGANYYELAIETDNYLEPDTVFFDLDSVDYQLKLVGSFIESITLPNAIEMENKSYLFDDSTFDSSYASISFSLIAEGIFGAPDLERLKAISFLKWSCLSEEQYLFDTSYLNYQSNQLFGPFSEPYSIYNNVENGLGYLGAENYYFKPFSE